MINTTFIFGLLSIFQAVFLPGYLFLKLLKFKTDKLTQAILSFALSMIVNYFIVFFMVLIGIFTTFNIRILFFIELIIFFILVYRNRQNKSFHDYKTNLQNWLSNLSNYEIIAFGILLYSFIFALIHLFGTFTNPDAVWSWNRWALEWYNGSIPDTRSAGGPYPQLITACTAIMYSITGYKFQFFPYFALASFPFFTLLIPYSLAKLDTDNSKSWNLSVIGVLFFISLMMREVGQADIPVAFMGFVSFYFIYITKFKKHTSKIDLYKRLFIIAILIGGTTLTKQAGWYILAISPIFIWAYIFRNKTNYSYKFIISSVTSTIIIALILAGSWYIYIMYLNTYSQNFNELVHLTDTHSILSKINKFKWSNLLILILSIAVTWRLKFCRFISVLVVIPFFIIWFHCFGYDKRNIALLLPFAGCIFGFALCIVVNFLSSFNSKTLKIIRYLIYFICHKIAFRIIKTLVDFHITIIQKKKFKYFSFIFIFLLILFCPLFSFNNLNNFHTYRIISTLGGRNISSVRLIIYNMKKNNELDGKVYTNYQYDRWLPDSFLKNYIVGDTWEVVIPKESFIKENNIKYIIAAWPSASNCSKIKKAIEKGYLKIIYKKRDFTLYKL